MKQSLFFILLALLTVGLLSTGFAKKGIGVSVPQPVVQVQQQVQDNPVREITRDEAIREARKELRQVLPSSKLARARQAMSKNRSTSLPVASKIQPSMQISSGLSGTIHIPSTGFPNIGTAVGILEYVGIGGNVTFILDNSSYLEDAIVMDGSYTGAGTYNVRFEPNTATAVTVNFRTDATEGKGFAFNGANNVTIDGLNTGGASLTLKYATGYPFPAGDAFAATVYATNHSQNITVQNANIQGNIQTASDFYSQTDGRPAVFVWAGLSDLLGCRDITVSYCNITNATYGFKVLPDNDGDGIQAINIYFTHNNIGGAFGGQVSVGALADRVKGMHYDYNVIDSVEFVPYYWEIGSTEYDIVWTFGSAFLNSFGQPTGGHLYETVADLTSQPSTMAYNWVKKSVQHYDDPGFGFIIYGLLARISGSGTIVHDNRIEGVHSDDADGTDAGIRSESGAIHNTILLSGTQLATQTSYCYRPAGGAMWNNAFSNTRTGAAGSSIRALQGSPSTAGGGNAYYSANGRITTATTVAGYFGAVDPTNLDKGSQYGAIGLDASLHLDLTAANAAEDIGRPKILLANDVDGNTRDTTIAGVRDAGADEVGTPSVFSTAADVQVTLINPPASSGIPVGLAQNPVVYVKNNSTTATGSFTVRFQVSDGYDSTKSVSLAALASGTVQFYGWIPATATSYTLTATEGLTSHLLSRSQSASSPVNPTSWTGASLNGWAMTDVSLISATAHPSTDITFVNTFTKLGGPYLGNKCVVTKAATSGNAANPLGGYSDQTATFTTSPFFKLNTGAFNSNVYISLYQSLNTEAGWDGSWMQYTTDGVTWKHLGTLNDPNGINWYNTSVYANAAGDIACFDTATYIGLGLSGHPVTRPPRWTSNGDCNVGDPDGTPNGWVYQQLHINASNYPDIVGAPIIKFRVVTMGDGGTHWDGWAFALLKIDSVASTFVGKITGTVKLDDNGDGNIAGDAAKVGSTVKCIGAAGTLTTTTDGSGYYEFTGLLPGAYNVRTGDAGFANTTPAYIGWTISQNGLDSMGGKDLGVYAGTISGNVFDDKDISESKNAGDVGLSAWTVQMRKDSATGAIVASTTTDGSGDYSIVAGPGSFYITETLKSGWENSFPALGYQTATVAGLSGTGSVAGIDLGNYKLATIKIYLTVDLDGDGEKGSADQQGLSSGEYDTVYVSKDAGYYQTIVHGNSFDLKTLTNQDVGSYDVTNVSLPPGYVATKGSGGAQVVSTSGQTLTFDLLVSGYVTVSGYAFDDKNGNGTKNGGDNGLLGRTINLTSTFNGAMSTTSDSNGHWSIGSVRPDSLTISQVQPSGWVATKSYHDQWYSGQVDSAVDLGSFKTITVSGEVYRDRDGDGTQDAIDNATAGFTVNLGASNTVSTGSGYSFTNVGPGTYALTQDALAGWTLVEGNAGYTVNATSGVDVTNNFGDKKDGDFTNLFRTFTPTELHDAYSTKDIKPSNKVGKFGVSNLRTLLKAFSVLKGNDLMGIYAGVVNTDKIRGGKNYPYVHPKDHKDVMGTNYGKSGVQHTTEIHGMDFYDRTDKLVTGRLKKLPADKQDNLLVANTLALSVSVVLSDNGKAGASGLGDLIYADSGNAEDGKMVRDILADANQVLTYWPGVTSATYANLNDVIGQILGAFSGAWSANDTPWNATIGATALVANGTVPVSGIAFLKANPGALPGSRHTQQPYIPTSYSLLQNYPNPFNPTTTISFDIPTTSVVTLKLYNMLGEEVATLFNQEEMDLGRMTVNYNASSLASGIYFYRLTATSVADEENPTTKTFTQVKKMMLLK